MRKYLLVAMAIAVLAIPTAAIAAVWRADNPNQNADWVALGAACPTGGEGDHTGGAWYHFVLNQVSPDFLAGVTVTAEFSGSPDTTVGPSAVNKKMQHFDLFGIGTLEAAFTNIDTGADSNLVISGAVCGKKGFPDRAGD